MSMRRPTNDPHVVPTERLAIVAAQRQRIAELKAERDALRAKVAGLLEWIEEAHHMIRLLRLRAACWDDSERENKQLRRLLEEVNHRWGWPPGPPPRGPSQQLSDKIRAALAEEDGR